VVAVPGAAFVTSASLLDSALVGVAIALPVVLLAVLLSPRPPCPRCGTVPAPFRRPRSFSQAVRGGWTCAACGQPMDRRGRATGGEASDRR
jgi:hypothetical protein